MHILFTVCGRAGSKGIKSKNSREFLGHSLVLYTLAAIDLYKQSVPEADIDVALNTDSAALLEIARDKVSMSVDCVERKPELGTDLVPKIAVIADTMLQMEQMRQTSYDMVVDFDLTAPLRRLADIQAIIDKKRDTDCDIVFSVAECRRNPYFNMVMETDRGYDRVIASNFDARQQAPAVYDMNASLYAYEPDYLKSGKGIFDGRCDIIEMIDTGILDLDRPIDFELMQVIAEYFYKQYPDYAQVRDHIPAILR